MATSEIIRDNALNIVPSLDKESTVIVTDPPFNIGYHYESFRDNFDEEDYLSILYSILHDRMAVVVHYPEFLYRLSHKLQTFPSRIISWVYNSNTPRQHRDIAFFNINPDFTKILQPYKNPNDKRIKERIEKGKVGAKTYDWFQVNQVKNVSKEKTKHPCQMPVETMLRVIGTLPDNLTIVDPFVGSGTTGVAAKILNRNFLGIDIVENYCQLARERIDNTNPSDIEKYNLIIPPPQNNGEQ